MDQAFDEIYKAYAQDVYRFALRLSGSESLAEDILQDTMLKAITSIDSFKGGCSMKTWLCTIARNEYLNHVKRMDNRGLPLDAAREASGDDDPFSMAENAELAVQIHRVLHRLEEPYREVFSLRVFAELKYDDIGSIFGQTANWASVTYFRAKKKLIAMLKEEGIL
ncbi:MAG: sigma-70 family RNA polymerase sigma factor [Oscillospiraceae bacterium]|jgi:RNA polymerase sigma-70 factor (ECF subfamily)|nr:sigma-70 family RNA polymerase sigma factor [Oscillospiraceae bacterium]